MTLKLFVFVEGKEDRNLLEDSLDSHLRSLYNHVYCWPYAQKTKEDVNALIGSINSISDAEYIFLTDYDNERCYTKVKNNLIRIYPSLDFDRIVIAREEIESWFLAGLKTSIIKKLKIPYVRNTEKVSKEQFLSMKPDNYSKEDFYGICIRSFDLSIAIRRNKSFRYFIGKLS